MGENGIGWSTKSSAGKTARRVGGTVVELESGRFVVRGEASVGGSAVYYGPRGATYTDYGGGYDLELAPDSPRPGVWGSDIDTFVVSRSGKIYFVCGEFGVTNTPEIVDRSYLTWASWVGHATDSCVGEDSALWTALERDTGALPVRVVHLDRSTGAVRGSSDTTRVAKSKSGAIKAARALGYSVVERGGLIESDGDFWSVTVLGD